RRARQRAPTHSRTSQHRAPAHLVDAAGGGAGVSHAFPGASDDARNLERCTSGAIRDRRGTAAAGLAECATGRVRSALVALLAPRLRDHSCPVFAAPATAMSDFDPQLRILPAAQRRLWPELRQVPPHFVLYGGTAVGLWLGHRQSLDFDFFSSESFVPEKLLADIPFLAGSVLLQSEPNTLTLMLERDGPVKVSFFG